MYLKLRYIFKNIKNKLHSFRNSEGKIAHLRSMGMKIGENCLYLSNKIPSEPYLVEIGNYVVISSSTIFITHDGSVWILRKENPELDVFGTIKIGNNTFIGIGCIILPGAEIGSNCIIGAGGVVRGKIPDNSVVIGNPGKVITNTNMIKLMITKNKHALPTKNMEPAAKISYIKKHFKLD